MGEKTSIYTRKELGKNFFLPEGTEDLYKKKKDLHFELDKIYEEITGKNSSYEEDRLIIANYLKKNSIIKEAILGDMSKYSTRKTLENLSKTNEMINLPKYKTRKIIKGIREKYWREILKCKKENNALTFTDLQKLKQINNQKNLEQEIVDKLKANPNYTYSAIARKYGLKDGRVAKKIIEKNYADIYCNFETKEEDRTPINKYEIAA